jgi:hypothetical protein
MEPLTHRPTSNNLEWNESYYFIFYDRENKVGGMSRVGFKPNKKDGMTFFFLFLPDGSIGAFHANDDARNYPATLKVEGVHFDYRGNGIWHYRFEGPMLILEKPEDFAIIQENPEVITDLVGAKIELEYKFHSDIYEYSEHMTKESLEIGKKSGDRHWEQIGKVSGSIRIGDKEYIIRECIGQRDHTHGVRDWTGIGNWFYFVIWFEDDLALNPAAVILDDGRIGSGGFIYRRGKNIPIKRIALLQHEYKKNGIIPVSTRLQLVDADGREYILEGKPGAIIPVPFKGHDGKASYLIQSFGSFQLDDIKGGYGSYEVLRKASEDTHHT